MSFEGAPSGKGPAGEGRPPHPPRLPWRLSPDHRVLLVLLALALVQGVAYAVITPPFAGPDELGHFDYVQLLWETKGDRSTWDSRPAPPNSERHQPATYYWLVTPGYALAADQPRAIQVVAIRLASVILFLAEVLFAYLTARLLSPSNRFVYLATPAVVALLPGRVWIAAMINNDNLAATASAALLYFFLRCVLCNAKWWSAVGVAVSVAVVLASKRTAFPVAVVVIGMGLAIVAAALVARIIGARRRRPVRLAAAAAGLLLLTGVVAAWGRSGRGGNLLQDQFVETARHVWSRLAGPLARLGETTVGALNLVSQGAVGYLLGTLPRFAQLPPVRPEPFLYQFKSFWLPLWRDDYAPPDAAYGIAAGVSLAAVVGLGLASLSLLVQGGRRATTAGQVAGVMTLLFVLASVWTVPLLRHLISVAGTESFISSQRGADWDTHARYLFPAIVPAAYLISNGLGRFVPRGLAPVGLAALASLLLWLDGVALHSLVSRIYWWPS